MGHYKKAIWHKEDPKDQSCRKLLKQFGDDHDDEYYEGESGVFHGCQLEGYKLENGKIESISIRSDYKEAGGTMDKAVGRVFM